MIVVCTLGAAAGAASAQPAPEKIGEVKVEVNESTTEFGRLHLSAALLGWQLSGPDGGPVSTLGAYFEVTNRLIAHGHATVPLLGFAGGEHAPWRLEAGGFLIVRNGLDVENEEVIISQTSPTGDTAGEKVYVKMPMVNRNRYGLDANLIVANGSEKIPEGTGTMTTRSTALIAAVGIGGIGSMGYDVTVGGHGKRSNYRWNTGGLDVLIDLTRSYDVEPAEKGSRFGGRLWAETLWFRHLGMSARAEIGKYPGYSGWMLVAALGGSLHL